MRCIPVAETRSAVHIDSVVPECTPLPEVLGNSNQDFDCRTEPDNLAEKAVEGNLEALYTVAVQAQ